MKYRHRESWPIALALLLLAPASAMAHPEGGAVSGLLAGLSHPLLGADHLLAMVAVGLWAAQLGGRALWATPAAFIVMLLLGGACGIANLAIPHIEAGILSSVLILGLLITAAVRLPVLLSAVVVGIFALFHGYAHGVEMPLASGGIAYSLGFALTTALLHGIGILLGLHAARLRLALPVTRLAGLAIASAGAWLAVA
ncbi:MAG: HupE/UreJ family protein [Gammaproteobacteria bacterium]|nr:HupE/UreJ family protein [Gammaproteobacteria bacterium]